MEELQRESLHHAAVELTRGLTRLQAGKLQLGLAVHPGGRAGTLAAEAMAAVEAAEREAMKAVERLKQALGHAALVRAAEEGLAA